jgi:hypothetical protein
MQQRHVEKVRNIEFEGYVQGSAQIKFFPVYGLVSSPWFLLTFQSLRKYLLPGTFLQYGSCHFKPQLAVMEFQYTEQAEVQTLIIQNYR